MMLEEAPKEVMRDVEEEQREVMLDEEVQREARSSLSDTDSD